jgi:hypothetical protein
MLHNYKLNTTSDVIDFLGGNTAVANSTCRHPSAISVWRTRRAFPASISVRMLAAVLRSGVKPNPHVFGISESDLQDIVDLWAKI